MDQLLRNLNLLKLVSCSEYEGTDCYTLFTQFYKKDVVKSKIWLGSIFKIPMKNAKNNEKSDILRKKGNDFFINGEWHESLFFFTKALQLALDKSESYALALANRSATLFSMKEYESCLNDIDRCLKSNYPDNLKYKIYIRKIQCYEKIGAIDTVQQTLKEGLDFISNNTSFSVINKEIFTDKLLSVKRTLPEDLKTICKPVIPTIIENDKFLGASSLIELRYHSKKGRHVVAQQDIEVGDILFVEKAFAIAPIFDGNLEFSTDICYYCLSRNNALIPCPNCTLCLYCDEKCRTKSWDESHRWECKGMATDFWSLIGLGLPAFRCFLKGIPSKFDTSEDSQKYVKVFGSKTDNYKYVYKLCTNITDANKQSFVHLTGILICYLETQTTFFKWLSEKMEMKNDDKFKILMGSILLRHVAQSACNPSVIQLYDNLSDYKYVPTKMKAIATGLYPSVSMMNHSCKPNVFLYYINDVVVVKAADSISKGDEIFNCYGVDYRTVPKVERMAILATQYNFSCACEICRNPKLEAEVLESHKCARCSGPVRRDELKCYDCGNTLDLSTTLPLENKIEKLLAAREIYGNINIECLQKSYDLIKKVFTPYHSEITTCHSLFYRYYEQRGEFDRAVEYFNKIIDCFKKVHGEYSWIVTMEIIGLLEEYKLRRRTLTTRTGKQTIKKLCKHVQKTVLLKIPDCYIKQDALEELYQQSN